MQKTNKTILTALGLSLLLGAGTAFADKPPHAKDAPHAASARAAAASTAARAPRHAAAAAEVAEAQFTTGIRGHRPVDEVTTLDNSHTQVYFFTDLRNMSGQTVTHRWTYNGNTVAEVKLSPKGARWRTWSSKTLDPVMTGTWTVDVVDDAGNVLTSKSFEYTKATSAPSAATH